jgi:hypothetical protein
MNWHPTDDDMILRLYDESTPAEARRIDAHVAICATCRESWGELVETLKLVDTADAPEPGPAFERLVWARVQQALPAPAASRWSPRQWMPAFGLAAAVIVAVAIGYEWNGGERLAPVSPDAAAAAARERVLLTALDGHFEQAEMLLVELMNAPEAGADQMAFRRATADDLVASGRLYRATAEDTGDVQFARMLDDLESVLIDLARSPETADQHEMESLRTRIGDEDLLFKVRAVTSDLRGRNRNRTESE